MSRRLEHLRGRMGDDLTTWLVTFVIVAVLGTCWALASPYYSGPDEPAHAMRAYSVAHGQVLGGVPDITNTPGMMVDVPEVFASSPGCYAFKPEVTAECFSLNTDTSEVSTLSTAGRHPPLYYGLAGLPSWLSSSGSGLMAMRVWSALMSAAFVASAMVTARRAAWGRWVPVAILVASTPMCFYMMGLVNPSGLEIATAISAWVNGLALIASPTISTRILLRFGAAASMLALVRHLGPLWLAIIIATMVVLAGWRRSIELLKDRGVQVTALVVGVAVVIQAAWLLVVNPLDPSRNGVPPLTISESDIWRAEVGQLSGLYHEWVGVFGWLDAVVPAFTYYGWAIVLGGFVLLGLSLSSSRVALVLLALIGLVIAIPTASEVPTVRSADFFWQGRYTLPLIVGVPIVAAYGLGRRSRSFEPNRIGLLAGGIIVWSAQVLAFWQVLRRYTVGADGTLWWWTEARWEPFVPGLALTVVYAVGVAGWVWICRPSTEPSLDGGPPPPAPSTTVPVDGMEASPPQLIAVEGAH